jgi:NADH-quinone oxidoreductase subunit G
VLPRLNEAVNEEWISDKTRFAVDGLVRRRLDRPYIRRGGKLVEAEWREALDLVADRLKATPGERIAAIAGDLCDAESMFALKDLLGALGATSLDCRQDGAKLDAACRAGYLFNTTIAGIEQADAVPLLIGTNPRWEAPIVNARLRKRYLLGRFQGRGDRPGARSDLPGRDARRGPGTRWPRWGRAATTGPNRLKDAKAPMLILGQGRWPGRTARRCSARRGARRKPRHDPRRLERVQRAASRGGAGRRA